MKKVTLCLLLVIASLFLSAQVNTEGKVVTSKILSIDDVKKNFDDYHFRTDRDEEWEPSDIRKGSLKIYGIHQEGNEATIYISFKYVFRGGTRYSIETKTVSLVRFNSGKWFILPEAIYLEK